MRRRLEPGTFASRLRSGTFATASSESLVLLRPVDSTSFSHETLAMVFMTCNKNVLFTTRNATHSLSALLTWNVFV